MEKPHNFALYAVDLADYLTTKEIILCSKQELAFRITKVLRLSAGDTITLFNEKEHVLFSITSIDKKAVTGIVLERKKNHAHAPSVRAILPLLKKNETDDAIYRLCEMGVDEIWLTTTEKTQRRWGGEHEQTRLQRIIIAAAEQSKQFKIPILKEPVPFDQIFGKLSCIKESSDIVFCDPEGSHLSDYLYHQKQSIKNWYTIVVGPEADLSQKEKAFLAEHKSTLVSLTPTVLRAGDALVLACGIIRSFLKE